MKYLFSSLLILLSSAIIAQDFYDLDNIQTIEITFSQSNWDALLDAEKAGDGDYIMAQSVTINGETFDSVGVKYKGNSSYNANQVKNPWHIELDTYKDHEYDGYTDIKLANGYNDPSFLRDVLGFEIIRKYMDAPLSNFANLYVNGTLIGLYTNTESISKKFVNSRFGSKTNAFFDCSPPDGAGPQSSELPNLEYLGQDSSDYYDAYDMKSDAGWQELIDLTDTLENNFDDIEKILDVDRALWMLAFDNAIVNLDSYIGNFKQNYYLYRSDYNQFLPIVWDLNESFGVFSQTGSGNLNNTTSKQQMSHLLHASDSDFPLVQQLLSDPMYKRMYLAHYKTILLENFDNDAYYTSALAIKNTIDASVQADPNKFYTYNNFISNLNNDITSGGGSGGPGGPGGVTIPGVTNLMDGRTSYLLNLADFTNAAPSISDITLSNTTPIIGENVTVTASVSSENAVYLGYRTATMAPFTRVEMFDDGAHGDGAANDGTYGVELEISNSSTQYYIYAENDNAGMFSPQRAQYEYYTISATVNTAESDVVINEFMASNDVTAADQDGEYDDWIELYNNGSESIDLEGFYLSDDADDLTQWTFPAGTVIEADGYLIIWADEDEDQDGLHANFKISASEGSLYLVDATGAIIDEVSYVDQETDISYARYPNGTGDFQTMNATFNAENILVNTAESDVAINEFMASNDVTAADQDGEFDDWIELYNNGSESIDLEGFYLSDDADDLMLWAFPAGTVIEPDGYLIIWADEDEDQDGLHANFKISASEGSLFLVNASGAIVDQVSYIDQTTDVAYARYPNGIGDFQTMNATFNAENIISYNTAESDVVLNEFMASNDVTAADQDGDYDDWIELYNNGSESIDLEGFYLSDDLTDLTQWAFPAGTTIDANGYLIIWADEDEDQDGLHANFKISASEGSLYLVDATGAVVDEISYSSQETDISYGRYPNGTGDFQTMSPTFNAENSVVTAVSDYTFQTDVLKAYPNPANNSFYLVINDSELVNKEVNIYSVNGTIAYQNTVAANTLIDCSTWTPGLYIIQVENAFSKMIVY